MIRSGSISTSAKFGRAKGIYYGFKSRYEWLENHKEYENLKPLLFKKVFSNLLQYVHECVKFNKEINIVKNECKDVLRYIKKEKIKTSKSTKIEMLIFIKSTWIYKLIYKLIRG